LGFYAKTLGTTAGELTKLSKLTDEQIFKTERMAKEQKDLDKLWSELGDTITPLKHAWQGAFASFLLAIRPVVVVFTELLGWITKVATGVSAFFQGLIEKFNISADAIKAFNMVVGLFVIAVGIGLPILLWKINAGFKEFIINLWNLGPNLAKAAANMAGLTGSTAQSTAQFEALAASISKVGVQLTDVNAKLAATRPTAGLAGIPGTTLDPKNLETQQKQQGAKAAGFFGTGFAKALGAFAIAGTMANVFTKKSFTLADLGMLALSIGPMLGPVAGPWFMAAGLAILLLTRVFPKLGNFDLLGGIMGKGGKAKSTATVSSTSSGMLDRMKRAQAEVAEVGQSSRSDTNDKMIAHLEEIKRNTSKTVSVIDNQTTSEVTSSKMDRTAAWFRSAEEKSNQIAARG
ncbi:MAG TPA: hypothetical protein VMV86_03665, partial [Methanosarcinales archaeon]|nr:hypothetical protein [Methanosarcinales archaeon]